jgi:replicative DNA helicase
MARVVAEDTGECPVSDTAERAGESVLGSLLSFYTPELITVVQGRDVTPDDFGPDRQRVVYRAILALHRNGVHVDDLTVEAFLVSHGCLERAGGSGYLAVLVASASPSGLKDHAAVVARGGRKARRRRKLHAAQAANDREDEVTFTEVYVSLGRDVDLPDEAPKLRVVRGAA